MPLSTSTIAMIVSSVTLILLLYFVLSKRGWNCTENGCVYVIGGSFDTYDKCNSICKTNNSQKQVVSQSQNRNNSQNNSQIDSYENQSDYQNPSNPPCDSNSNSQLDSCIFPYQPYPYYSYLPGPFYHDNYWYRDKKHKKEKRKDSIKNHNENNIFINSPTGPNSI